MSPTYVKRYNKTKARHQRKELDERKKQITGLTLVQDMGQQPTESERKGLVKATTGFTRAVQEFGEQRRFFDTKAYTTAVSRGKPRPSVTKGRLTVPTQGLFARGKISRPVCREPPLSKRSKSQKDCDLHKIIRLAQDSPRGQQYQVRKLHVRDHSPEIDDPDPELSPNQSEESFQEPRDCPRDQDDRFSPIFTSTKDPIVQQPCTRKWNAARNEPSTSTHTMTSALDETRLEIDVDTLSAPMSPTLKELLTPDYNVSDESIRQMELEEQMMDGISQWVIQFRESLNISKLEYLDEARQYLKNIHKETIRREQEEDAIAGSLKHTSSKSTTQTMNSVLQTAPEATLEKGQKMLGEDKVTRIKTLRQTRANNQNTKPIHGDNHQALPQMIEKVWNPCEVMQKPPMEPQSHVWNHAQQVEPVHEIRPFHQPLSSVHASDSLNAGNPFAQRYDTIDLQRSLENIGKSEVIKMDIADATDESFCFSPVVSTDKVITDPQQYLAVAFGATDPSQNEMDGTSSEVFDDEENRRKLRAGRERVNQYTIAAMEEIKRLHRKKEREYHETYEFRNEAQGGEFGKDERFTGTSRGRIGHRVSQSPGRNSRSLERVYQAEFKHRHEEMGRNGKEDDGYYGRFREGGKLGESRRKFGGENRLRYLKDERSRAAGCQQPWDGERKDKAWMNYREGGMNSEERSHRRSRDNDSRSPVRLPTWLLEKTPERVFHPRKMFD